MKAAEMLVGALAELGEHAEGGFGVEKGDEFVSRALERDFVDEPGALVLGVAELAGDVVRGEREVVDAGAVFLEEFGDRAVVGRGFEEFQMDFADSEEGGFDLLGFDFFAAFAF
jgi:hypothetical protein